jgi:hypothetical protein
MPRALIALCWWTLICGLSAAPGFVLGLQTDAAVPGMIAGIATFIIGYTLLSCTPFAERLYSNRIWRRTIHIGYGTRMALSIASGLAWVGFPLPIFLDVWCGLVGIAVSRHLVGDEKGLAFGYLATLVDGVLLNIILAVFMLIVYTICRKVMPPPDGLRGFDVLPRAIAGDEVRIASPTAAHATEFRTVGEA